MFSLDIMKLVSKRGVNLKDDAEILSRLGLTASQGKVYVALLKLGTDSKGTTIAKFAAVPRQDVYRLLSELQHIGIVQKTLDKPAKFRSTPPKEAVNILLRRKMDDFSELKREADIFAKRNRETINEASIQPEKDQFVLITDRETITCRISKAYENTQATTNSITPLNELVPWLTVLSKHLDEALGRGVKIRWITDKPKDTNWNPKYLQTYIKHENFKLRFVSNPLKAKIAIHDSKEVIFGIFTDSGFARSPALWSNNPSLATIAESYFETIWKSGVDIKPKKNKLVNA
jgi:sugar-specific transcriptional regulator TrmB